MFIKVKQPTMTCSQCGSENKHEYVTTPEGVRFLRCTKCRHESTRRKTFGDTINGRLNDYVRRLEDRSRKEF
jgi:uncharacterized Zn finger protein